MDLTDLKHLARSVANEMRARAPSRPPKEAPYWVLAQTQWNRRWEHGTARTLETTTHIYALHPDGRLLRHETVSVDQLISTTHGLQDHSAPSRTTSRLITAADVADLDRAIAYVSSRFSQPETRGTRFTTRRISDIHGGGITALLNRLRTDTPP